MLGSFQYVLQSHPALVSIDVTKNKFTLAAGQLLADLARSNTVLTTIKFDHEHVNSELRNIIAAVLAANVADPAAKRKRLSGPQEVRMWWGVTRVSDGRLNPALEWCFLCRSPSAPAPVLAAANA